jgi:arylsulfatase A-like enzyme
VGALAPHDPYFVPQRYLDYYDPSRVELPVSFQDTLEDKPRIYRRIRRQIWDQLSEQEVKEARRHYWACCTQLDELFGKFLERLEDLRQVDNTLVLYCSDHGDYCGDHGLFTKGIPCFQGAYNVPAVMRWPQGITHPGRRVDSLISLADFAPTFIEMCSGITPSQLSGRSLLPFFKNIPPQDWRDTIHTQCNGVELYYSQRSIMTKDFKYVFNGFDEDELYDLRIDPEELHNVALDNNYNETKRELVRRMWRFAYSERDTMINDYCTVALAPYGPREAFR